MFDLPKYGDGVCLARMANLLDALAVDRARLSRISVVVTGSNGKGSTAAFCAGIARGCGLRTGLFTSPHLYRWNERVRVDGADIGDDDLARLKPRIEEATSEISRRTGEKFGAFEALFALACLFFQERDCGFAVFEAGIGGRYDPVRLAGAQLVNQRGPCGQRIGHLAEGGLDGFFVLRDRDIASGLGRVEPGQVAPGIKNRQHQLRCQRPAPGAVFQQT